MARPLAFPEFAGVPDRYGRIEYLYALESGDGVVKVGRSFKPRVRLTVHAKLLRERGQRVLRFHVEPGTTSCYENEREVLRRLAPHGQCLPGTAEWFVGVPWGLAKNLVRQMARRQFVTLG